MFIGISAYFHESTVSLIDGNGSLKDFQREDWHSRVKGDKSFPRLALLKIIKDHNLNTKNIIFVFYEKPLRSWLTIAKHSVQSHGLFSKMSVNNFKNFWKSSISFYFDLNAVINGSYKDIFYSDHHLSHALSNYQYDFGFDFPIVSVVLDGYGDSLCASAFLFDSTKKISEIWTSDYPNSLGLFYSAITDFLGLPINDAEFKVMGLSSFGKPKYVSQLRKMISFENKQLKLNMKYFDFDRSLINSYSKEFEKLLNIPANISPLPINKTSHFNEYADIACSAQIVLTENIIKLLEYLYDKTKVKKFHLTGGVALNCKMIESLSALPFIDNLFVPPSPGDSGASIGAGYFGYLNSIENTNSQKQTSNNLFPGNFSQDTKFMDEIFNKLCGKNDLIDEIIKLLLKDEILATCFGNIETGPRSLGNRSLICNAANNELVKRLSIDVKGRDEYVPVAPSMLIETAKKFYELKDNIHQCYYSMSATAQLKSNFKDFKFKSIVHSDNTSRIQICNEKTLIGKILSNSNKKLEILANTSFNFSNDPVSYSYEDSILAMKKMNVDYLITDSGLYKI